MKWPRAFVSVALAVIPFTVQAAEPSFCQPANFSKFERGHGVANLERAHVYRIGSLTLVGLGVGQSDPRAVQQLARQHGVQDGASCTWYFNDGNDEASRLFNHVYLPSPIFSSPAIAKTYMSRVAPQFTQRPILACAGRERYIAMGCDGMRHRGPSVFAMFLSYAGCSAENATRIANNIWGNNYVPTQTRQAIAAEGKRLGDLDPAGRAYIQKLMGVKP